MRVQGKLYQEGIDSTGMRMANKELTNKSEQYMCTVHITRLVKKNEDHELSNNGYIGKAWIK